MGRPDLKPLVLAAALTLLAFHSLLAERGAAFKHDYFVHMDPWGRALELASLWNPRDLGGPLLPAPLPVVLLECALSVILPYEWVTKAVLALPLPLAFLSSYYLLRIEGGYGYRRACVGALVYSINYIMAFLYIFVPITELYSYAVGPLLVLAVARYLSSGCISWLALACLIAPLASAHPLYLPILAVSFLVPLAIVYLRRGSVTRGLVLAAALAAVLTHVFVPAILILAKGGVPVARGYAEGILYWFTGISKLPFTLAGRLSYSYDLKFYYDNPLVWALNLTAVGMTILAVALRGPKSKLVLTALVSYALVVFLSKGLNRPWGFLYSVLWRRGVMPFAAVKSLCH